MADEEQHNQEIFRQIEALYNDPDELKKLVKYAHRFMNIHQWETGLTVPQDYDAEDIVGTVIEKNLDGSRGQGFDPSQGTISAWLRRQIEWEIKNKARWDRSVSEVPIPTDKDGEYHDEQLHHLAEGDRITPHLQPDNPENILVSEEWSEAKWNELYEAVEGDKELEEIVKALENGCDMKPRNLAAELGWDVERVYNAKKRLDRRVPPQSLGEHHEPR
ncbi:MAG: hypothetical protein F9K27_17575 [Anaerolineae bacterium]|nr:MAG: hypothetical protein F9K27_17575 [Anaerolineae bacterium]